MPVWFSIARTSKIKPPSSVISVRSFASHLFQPIPKPTHSEVLFHFSSRTFLCVSLRLTILKSLCGSFSIPQTSLGSFSKTVGALKYSKAFDVALMLFSSGSSFNESVSISIPQPIITSSTRAIPNVFFMASMERSM